MSAHARLRTPPPPRSATEQPRRRWLWRLGLVAALLAGAAYGALRPDWSQEASAQTTPPAVPEADVHVVPADWALKPSGLGAGDRF
ncbi:MAG: hypothetical protein OXG47_07015, partial [bacterium]|nr:hypothetical protein [bacterium]